MADDDAGTAGSQQDPFDTTALRRAVLAGWAASVDRFREDANSEQDLALGGYRDRVVVELAQNAADAAARAGVPGRLLLSLGPGGSAGVLVAANTGHRLDRAGVRALSTLRASAKRGGAAVTGRFGVGFSAVLAVSDEPAVVGSGTGVRFCRADTLAAVRAAAGSAPTLVRELARRGDQVPVLRLPWPAQGGAPQGYDTAVLLPLRDGSASDLVEHLLGGLDDTLLLALPALAEVVVELPGVPPRRLADVAQRWTTLRRNGIHDPADLTDRPTEERARGGWSVTWALPRGREVAVPAVLHAPTPTAEPMDWPALLLADLPLDPDRRHVVDSPAARRVAAEAGSAYAGLVADVAALDPGRALSLVPVGLAVGWFDGAVREAALTALAGAPVLSGVEHGELLRPRDAVALEGAVGDDPAALAVLAPVLAGLVAAPHAGRAALRRLGVRSLELAEVVEAWPVTQREGPGAWSARYAGLVTAAAGAGVREALAGLPVPLVDGRVVRGVRGLVLPVDGAAENGAHEPGGGPGLVEAMAVLADHGLRVVDAAALVDDGARGLLERLGAVPATAGELLEHPAVRSAVRWTTDDDDPLGTSEAVLALVSAAWRERPWRAGDLGWLTDLALPDADQDPTPAGLLVLPGSAAERLLDPDAVGVLHPDVAGRWSAEVLQAVGVASRPVLVRSAEVDLTDLPPELDELDGAREWARAALEGAGPVADLIEEVLAVRDLDLVRDEAWGEMLGLLGDDAELRPALVDRVLVPTRDGGRAVPSYTAWWLRERLGLGATSAPGCADPLLRAVLDPAPAWAQGAGRVLRVAVGLVEDWDDLSPDAWQRVVHRLPDVDPALVTAPRLVRLWADLASAPSGASTSPARPEQRDGDRLWALDADGNPVRVNRDQAVVADDQRWAQRTDLGARLLVAADRVEVLADVFDLDLGSDRAPGRVAAGGRQQPVPPSAGEVLQRLPGTWVEHADLRVDGTRVGWWVEPSDDGRNPVLHASTPHGLARALAFAADAWGLRHRLAAALVDQDPQAVVEGAYDPS